LKLREYLLPHYSHIPGYQTASASNYAQSTFNVVLYKELITKFTITFLHLLEEMILNAMNEESNKNRQSKTKRITKVLILHQMKF